MEHRGDRIVLDAGLPLRETAFRDLLPDVPGMWATGDGSLKGLFISHGHPDHHGLADLVDPEVPIYMGAQAKAIIDEAGFFTSRKVEFGLSSGFSDGVEIRAGKITVTPFLVDHSGFEAYSFLVEAGQESLFYTGDIRFHGRKATRMATLATRLPDDLNCLITEGTNLGRPGHRKGFRSEGELEDHLTSAFKATEGSALAFYSAQNIDRLVTVYRAAIRSGRKLVIDLYGASIAAATGKRTIPQSSWSDVRVCLRSAERIRIKQSRQFDRIRALGASRIYTEEIAADPSQYVITSRLSSLIDLERAGCLANSRAFWSMWDGYLARDERLRRRLDRLDIPIELAHVSGHAHASDLLDFADRLGAASIVPVHSEAPELLEAKLGSVTPKRDGEWWRPESLSERVSEQDERNGRRI